MKTRHTDYALLLVAGAGVFVGRQLASPYVVLPWIASHAGAGHLLAVLVLPMFQFGQITSQLGLGPKLSRFRIRKWPVAGSAVSISVFLALIAASLIVLPRAMVAPVLLMCALGYGAGLGVYTVGQQDIFAKTIPRDGRGSLLGRRATLGGLLTLGVCLYLQLAPGSKDDKITLIWVGAAVWVVVASAYAMVREEPGAVGTKKSVLAEIERGFTLIRRVKWFRRFMTARVILLLIELTLACASIHAATVHLGGVQALSLFVAASSIGVMLSGPVFGRMTDRHPGRVIIIAGLLTMGSGVIALTIQAIDWLQNPYFHALTFTLLSLARQGVIQARVNYLSHRAPDDERPLYISISNSLAGALGIVVAAILGWVAHLHDIVVPIIILSALIGGGSVYAARLLRDDT